MMYFIGSMVERFFHKDIVLAVHFFDHRLCCNNVYVWDNVVVSSATKPLIKMSLYERILELDSFFLSLSIMSEICSTSSNHENAAHQL